MPRMSSGTSRLGESRLGRPLLALVLERLADLDRPAISLRDLEPFSTDADRALRARLLRETSRAHEVVGPRGDLFHVQKTPRGLVGVSDDGYADPIPLTDEDVRQYEVSMRRLVELVAGENGIPPRFSDAGDGLYAVGEKTLDGGLRVEAFLSVGDDPASLTSKCRRVALEPSGDRGYLVLTPAPVPLPSQDRAALLRQGVLCAPFSADGRASLLVGWSDVRKRLAAALRPDEGREHILVLSSLADAEKNDRECARLVGSGPFSKIDMKIGRRQAFFFGLIFDSDREEPIDGSTCLVVTRDRVVEELGRWSKAKRLKVGGRDAKKPANRLSKMWGLFTKQMRERRGGLPADFFVDAKTRGAHGTALYGVRLRKGEAANRLSELPPPEK